MCKITERPKLQKRVSFGESKNEVFAVEKVDASLIQDLFYNREDYRRFRSERRQAVVSTNAEPAQLARPQPRRQVSATVAAARRQKFQQLVNQKRTAGASARLVRESRSTPRRAQTLQGMRSHMRVAGQ